MSFGADWKCSCGWSNLDLRRKCRNCGAINPNAVPQTANTVAAECGLTDAEMKAQGARCGCGGADDYCPCQNVPDAATRRQRASEASR